MELIMEDVQILMNALLKMEVVIHSSSVLIRLEALVVVILVTRAITIFPVEHNV